MTPLQPIVFTPAIERIEWRQPEVRELVPGETYYTPPYMVEAFDKFQHSIGSRLFTTTTVTGLPYWSGESLDGKRVAYVADGRLGDQCVHTAIYRELNWRYPTMDLHAYVHSLSTPNDRIVSYNRDIGGHGRAFRFALSQQQIESFDYLITPTNVGYEYRGKDQRTHYELFEEDLNISIRHKKPYFYLPEQENEAVRGMLTRGVVERDGEERGPRIASMFFEGESLLFQLNASESSRSPKTKDWFYLLAELRGRLPKTVFGLCGDWESILSLERVAQGRIQGVYAFASDPKVPGPYLSSHAILHLLKSARAVIAPDSFLMHASAAFDVPCVALWQTDEKIIETERIPPPEARIKHYENVQALGMDALPEEIANTVMGVMK